jgi:hypothetical protein
MMIYRQGKLDDVAADLDLSPEELDGMRIESHRAGSRAYSRTALA